jgi:hypothetical protein
MAAKDQRARHARYFFSKKRGLMNFPALSAVIAPTRLGVKIRLGELSHLFAKDLAIE